MIAEDKKDPIANIIIQIIFLNRYGSKSIIKPKENIKIPEKITHSLLSLFDVLKNQYNRHKHPSL